MPPVSALPTSPMAPVPRVFAVSPSRPPVRPMVMPAVGAFPFTFDFARARSSSALTSADLPV